MKKKYTSIIAGIMGVFVAVVPAFAHVVVNPATVGVGAYETFSMSVPNEKDVSTAGLRLLIPDGLKSVMPNVKQGWIIDMKKSGEGESAKITEIDWTGGSIPSGQRDEFSFSAQVPSTEATLKWKAYQQYQGGEVVEWIHDPSKNPEDDSAPPPYSQTKVVNDFKDTSTDVMNMKSGEGEDGANNSAMLLAIIALALSAAAFAFSLRKRK